MRTFEIFRRSVIVLALAAPFTTAAAATVDVWKSPTCGCCEAWIAHLRTTGFSVRAHDIADPATVRARLGVPPALASCHTATVDGYVIEGHVPAGDLARLLRERPRLRGLAVPGMPPGASGMRESTGSRAPFSTLVITRNGHAQTYAVHAEAP